MAEAPAEYRRVQLQNKLLREENARLQQTITEIQTRLREPEDILRAIREGEVDALVVQEKGQEEIYAVQRYDAVYRGIVEESLPYGVWLADVDGKLLYASRQFLEVVQTDIQEMRKQGQFHFLPEDVREAFAKRWAESRATGKPCDFSYTVRLPDGSERAVWTHGILAQSYDGTPCWAGTNLDVTEQKKTRDELHDKAAQLEEADRRKDEFLALLGHELRNPLAVIQHGLHLLQLSEGDGPADTEVMESMTNQINNLTRLVDDLLDVSRISRGRIELRKEQVELATVVHASLEAVRSLMESRGHDLSISLPSAQVYLEADRTRLEQVLANLLSNAAKYTKPGGTIHLGAAVEHGFIVIRVRDNGIGIRPEMLSTIFNLFVQSDQALDRAEGGLGIGLTIVHRLVELHGGSITAHSDGPGKGSEFVVRLPTLLQRSEQVPVSQPAASRSDATAKVRILLAEDSEDLAQLLKVMLRSWGHEVYVTDDGPSTLEAYHQHHPDVVLLDVGLPEMDGYEVARKIRSSEADRHPVVVAMTGYGQERDRMRSREAGFDHHLVKPADLDELREILASASASSTP